MSSRCISVISYELLLMCSFNLTVQAHVHGLLDDSPLPHAVVVDQGKPVGLLKL